MKQDIRCYDCRNKVLERYKIQPSDEITVLFDPHPGEHIKIVRGKAKKLFLCDTCGIPIQPDAFCFAVSVWADYGGIPYYEWEQDYIIIPAERNEDVGK